MKNINIFSLKIKSLKNDIIKYIDDIYIYLFLIIYSYEKWIYDDILSNEYIVIIVIILFS